MNNQSCRLSLQLEWVDASFSLCNNIMDPSWLHVRFMVQEMAMKHTFSHSVFSFPLPIINPPFLHAPLSPHTVQHPWPDTTLSYHFSLSMGPHLWPWQTTARILDHIHLKGKVIPALTGPEGSRKLRFPDFKTIGTWRWQGCHPYTPTTFTPTKYTWYSLLLEAESTPGSLVQLEWLCQWKIPMTPSGIYPVTFRFVAQCLNHCATACPLLKQSINMNWH
jgi:hypothetical protein